VLGEFEKNSFAQGDPVGTYEHLPIPKDHP
jgi:hypothetical protein